MHFAAGQAESPTAPRWNLRRLQRVLIPAGAAAVAFVGMILVLRGGSPEPRKEPVAQGPAAPRPVAKEPPKIVWTIKSDPAGAQVVRKSDNTVLGVTPWRMEQTAARGTLDLILHKEGYADRPLALALDKDADREVSLAPVPKPTVKPTRPTSTRPTRPGRPPKKETKPDEDIDLKPVR
jgi:hypothetical protein